MTNMEKTVLQLLTVLTFLSITVHCANLREKRQARNYECPYSNGHFADPDDCRYFYNCNNGHPYRTKCPPGLYFDDRSKYCNYKTSPGFECGPVEYVPTPKPTKDPLTASRCSTRDCQLPDCFCSVDGTKIPGNLEPSETPQMILLAFDGALNGMTDKKYMKLFNESRLNPNGCPISATFFVSHEYTSYHSVQSMFAKGHEIALNSITYRSPEKWWATASMENLTEEYVGEREIMYNFANIEREDVMGIRAPYLEPGGENQFEMMQEFGFLYDSSIAVPKGRLPIWPYTLDHKVPHKCHSKHCPKRSYPGLWEIPLNAMYSEDDVGGICYLADQCVFFPTTEELVYDWLIENFRRHHDTNRAPLGLSFHINWFNEKIKVDALNRFIETILKEYKNTYFVNTQQLISWMQDPQPLNSFDGFSCPKRPAACNLPKSCALAFDNGIYGGTRYMPICNKCPSKYPWIGNYDGSYIKNYILEEISEVGGEDNLIDEDVGVEEDEINDNN